MARPRPSGRGRVVTPFFSRRRAGKSREARPPSRGRVATDGLGLSCSGVSDRSAPGSTRRWKRRRWLCRYRWWGAQSIEGATSPRLALTSAARLATVNDCRRKWTLPSQNTTFAPPSWNEYTSLLLLQFIGHGPSFVLPSVV